LNTMFLHLEKIIFDFSADLLPPCFHAAGWAAGRAFDL